MLVNLLFWVAVFLVVLYVGRIFRGARARTLDKTEQAAREAVRRTVEKSGYMPPPEDLVHCTVCDQHVSSSIMNACQRQGCPKDQRSGDGHPY